MPGSTALDDVICTYLSRLYQDHASRTDRLTCKLEHALPIRHSFFRLKRVPHFQTRDDLHSEHTPAYIPVYRLENASLESLSQKSKAGCRRVLIEGDLGTGKTLVCQRLLHEWAKAMQFFRHVKVDQQKHKTPSIKVGCDGDGSQSAKHAGACDKGNSEKKQKLWNLEAIQSSSTQNVTPKHVSHSKQSDSSSGPRKEEKHTSNRLSGGVEELKKDVTKSKSVDENLNRLSSKEDDSPGASDKDPHRSRKSLFAERQAKRQEKELLGVKEEDTTRSRSRNKKVDESSSRSRSSGALENERNTKRLRERARLICNGIPQKYLSLLNMGTPGEGSFESPSRSKTFREARRQRPSRLTSNLTDYKAIVYIPCVRMALSDLLARCNNSRVRHYYVTATVLLDLLTLSGAIDAYNISFESVYQWVLGNRDDICIIFDNVDGSEAWERLIADTFHDAHGFGKVIAAATPGRLPKRDVDILFYCYGLSTEYSNKILLNRLRTEAPDAIDRISFLLTSNHTQELMCNPLSLSLLTAYCRSVKPEDHVPVHLSELLEHLLHHAMPHESNFGGGGTTGASLRGAPANKGNVTSNTTRRRNRFSLQSVCETVAFECLENDTNYFSKQKFPQTCWIRHLCDCRVLHEVHEVANFASIHARPPSPTISHPLPLTPDSDSVHSSASSNFSTNLQQTSELSSSNQSLASGTDQDAEIASSNTTINGANHNSNQDGMSGAGPVLLQVPSLHSSSSSEVKGDKKHCNVERPSSLTISGKRSSSPISSTSATGKQSNSQQQQHHNYYQQRTSFASRSEASLVSASAQTGAQTTATTTQTGGDIVSFTSRCIRDYLASKRVCRYLQSDRDHEGFIRRLISRPQFYPVLRLTVRTLYLLERSDLVLNLLDLLMTSQELISSGQGPFALAIPSPPRGPSPTHAIIQDPQHRVRIPHRYRLSHSDCAFRAKREDLKQRRSSTSILGTFIEGGGPTPSPSLNRLLLSSTALANSLSPFSSPEPPENTHGYLEDFKEALIWLAETDNSEPYIGAVSARFPQTLVISYQECPSETIDHFICLTRRSQPAVQEVVLFMSGLYTQFELGLRLAHALRGLSALESLKISMKCVMDTTFLVEFLCECFENNQHIERLHLEGPMNVAENLSGGEHRRIHAVFGNRQGIRLKELILEHFSYHHRVSYVLASWPDGSLEKLTIKRSSVEGVADRLKRKLTGLPHLTHLTLDNCFVTPQTLGPVVTHLTENASFMRLTSLELTLLSSARKFNKNDSRKPFFRPALTDEVCELLARLVRVSNSLRYLLLSHNGINDDRAATILRSSAQSQSLLTLDLSANLITNKVESDVMFVLSKAKGLTSLFLNDNNITKATRSAIIRESLSRHDLRLSL
ncbi:hypothetical protein EGW08_017879 [Elysia chlorotica]|uniref:NACHT domain-containing protein n=1 Tax=Elysia chlorotica TaxID=188477 RepID=A0A3S1B856_ELYCH|nr:hypothetical protein EGW08_017879 [Elysia chlorotica]